MSQTRVSQVCGVFWPIYMCCLISLLCSDVILYNVIQVRQLKLDSSHCALS